MRHRYTIGPLRKGNARSTLAFWIERGLGTGLCRKWRIKAGFTLGIRCCLLDLLEMSESHMSVPCERMSEKSMMSLVSRVGLRLSQTALVTAMILTWLLGAGPALAEKIPNNVAVFSGLDKITGRIIQFDVYIDETVQFGALQVTPRVCYTRPETERQQVSAFVEVDEITLERKVRRIFTGWMFAASPGLNAVEHGVYDVWLAGCKQDSEIPKPQ